MTAEDLTCELCYLRGPDVQIGLAWYRDGGKEPVQSIARCNKDRAGCRTRVEKRGDAWPLLERDEVPA